MDTWSVADVARQLATSVPRVRRAIATLGIEPTRSPHGDRLSHDDIGKLVARLGNVPPEWAGTREEAFVLAAINRRPLGLRSERAVARAAGVSPTTAGTALRRLIADHLVATEQIRIVEGTAVDVNVFVVNRGSDAWQQVARVVRAVVVPEGPATRTPAVTVPHRMWHHFWNGRPSQIRLPRDENYVAARLLQSGDPEALAWACEHLSQAAIANVADLRGVPESSRATIRILAGSHR